MLLDYFYLFLYKSFSFFVKVFPVSVTNRFMKFLSNAAWALDKKHTGIIYTNLDLAFDNALSSETKESIAKRAYYNLLQVLVGFTRRENATKESLLENITFQNDQVLLDALENKKKIICVTGHYSNWELLPPAIAAKYNIPLVGVGRKLDSNLMNDILLKNREKFGVEMIEKEGAVRGAVKALKENKPVGFLLDQNLNPYSGAIDVKFFGKDVRHSPAASTLARAFDAVTIPAFISTDDYRHYTVTFYDPIPCLQTDNKEEDIRLMTQAQADITEEVIRAKPEEWFWLHRRWKAYYPEIYS